MCLPNAICKPGVGSVYYDVYVNIKFMVVFVNEVLLDKHKFCISLFQIDQISLCFVAAWLGKV